MEQPAHITGSTPVESVEITLRLDVVEGPPTGSATAGELVREFSGWLGLMSAIDALVVENDAPATGA